MTQVARSRAAFNLDEKPEYEGISLGLFSINHPVRHLCIQIIGSNIFGGFILGTILINCVFLALDDGNSQSNIGKISGIADLVFTAIFTVEAMIRIIAQGFYWCGENSYLRDSYNCLDFIVVLLSYISFAGSGANLSFFRALRILKPLRAIKAIKGLRILTTALFESLEGLGNVLLFFSFCLFVFGIIGMQTFGGRLKNRCAVTNTTTGIVSEYLERTCWPNSKLDAFECETDAGEICADYGKDPNNGVISFDNILVSWLTILQVTSLEGWVDVMYYCGDAVSKTISAFYFISLVMILSLFVRNLILAVLFIKFNKEKHADVLDDEVDEDDGLVLNFFGVSTKKLNENSKDNKMRPEGKEKPQRIGTEEKIRNKDEKLPSESMNEILKPEAEHKKIVSTQETREEIIAEMQGQNCTQNLSNNYIPEERKGAGTTDKNSHNPVTEHKDQKQFLTKRKAELDTGEPDDGTQPTSEKINDMLSVEDNKNNRTQAKFSSEQNQMAPEAAEISDKELNLQRLESAAERGKRMQVDVASPKASDVLLPLNRKENITIGHLEKKPGRRELPPITESTPNARRAKADGRAIGKRRLHGSHENNSRDNTSSRPLSHSEIDSTSLNSTLKQNFSRDMKRDSGSKPGQSVLPGVVSTHETFNGEYEEPGNGTSKSSTQEAKQDRASDRSVDIRRPTDKNSGNSLTDTKHTFSARNESCKMSGTRVLEADRCKDSDESRLKDKRMPKASADEKRANHNNTFNRISSKGPLANGSKVQQASYPTDKHTIGNEISLRNKRTLRADIHKMETKNVRAGPQRMERAKTRNELDFIQELECYQKDCCCFNCPEFWQKRIKPPMRYFVETQAFQGWISIAIFVNMILLTLEHFEMSEVLTQFLDLSNIILTSVFALEMILKLIGLGWQEYSKDTMNNFDALVVLVSFIELFLDTSSGLTALRCFRLLRILKLFRNWPDLRKKVDALFSSIEEITYFVGLMFLFMFIYAILGAQLFRGKFVIDGEPQRPNFDNFLWSMLTVFQIITGENWNEVLSVGVRVGGWGASMYFVTLYLFGGILLDLFLAILLTHMMDADKKKDEDGDQVSFSDLMISALLCRFNEKEKVSDDENLDVSINVNYGSSKSILKIRTMPSVSGVDNHGLKTSRCVSPISQQSELKLLKRVPGQSMASQRSTSGVGGLRGLKDSRHVSPSSQQSELKLFKDVSGQSMASPLGSPLRPVDENGVFFNNSINGEVWGKISRPATSTRSPNGSMPRRLSRKRSIIMRKKSISNLGSPGTDKKSPFDLFAKAKNEVLDNPTLPAAAYSKRPKDKVYIVEGKSFFIFSPDNSFRMMILDLVESEGFSLFIMFLIFTSCILLTLDTPRLDPDSTLAQFLYIADILMTVLFFLEMIMKCIAFGCWGTNKVHPEEELSAIERRDSTVRLTPEGEKIDNFENKDKSPASVLLPFSIRAEAKTIEPSTEVQGPYFSDGWNVLDASVVFISVVNIFAGSLSFFKAFRALRSLRALRAVSRSEETKVVMKTIIRTFFKLHNIVLIAMMIFVIFAVIGVQFFQGRLRLCIDDDGEQHRTLDITECQSRLYTWRNPELRNFDNTGSAILLLFEVASMEMWPDIMFSVIDATPPGEPPEENYNPAASLYFICFLVLGSFLIVSMFVGAVVGVYEEETNRMMEGQEEEDEDLSDLRRLWLEVYKMMVEMKPQYVMMPPQAGWRKIFFIIVEHPYFEMFIMVVICINVLLMALVYTGASDEYLSSLEILNVLCSSIFILEMICKLLGLGFDQYIGNAWNRFDCALVLLSVLTLSLQSVVTLAVDPTIFRIFRILRIFRLLPKAEGLKKVVRTLKFSLPALYNILFLLALFIFVFAVMGMSLFGKVKHGNFLDDHANFETFPTAVVTLFRITTGESWNGIMHDCMVQPPNCSEEEENCGSIPWALIYFPLYILVSFYAMLNLFVAVVLKNFEAEEGKSGEGNKAFWGKSPILQGDIEKYSEMWSEVFPNQSFIPLDDLIRWGVHLQFVQPKDVITTVRGKQTVKKRHFPFSITRKEMKKLNVPVWNNQIHYLSLIQKLALRRFTQRYEHLHNLKTERAVAAGKKPPDPIVGNPENAFFRGISRDNQILQCINSNAQSEYPELSKLKNFIFLSNQYFAATLLKNWWVARKKARGQAVKIRSDRKEIEVVELKGTAKVFEQIKEWCCCGRPAAAATVAPKSP